MRTRKARAIPGIAALLLVAALPARAAEPLSLSDCIATALAKNPAGRSADSAAAGARESAAAARAVYYPSLGLAAGISRWQRRIFLPEGLGIPGVTIPTIVGPLDDFALSLHAEYTLFDAGRRKSSLGAARAGAGAAAARRGQTRQDIALEVTQAFYGLASAQQMRDVARESLARARDHLRIARDRKEAGAAPLVDVLRTEVEVSNAQLDLVASEGKARVARGRLATAMGLPAETDLSISADFERAGPPDPGALSSALERAAGARPSVVAAEKSAEAAGREVARARSAFGPNVRAFASYGWEDETWLPSDKTWSVGFGVSLPIFTGFSRVHDLARARLELEKARAEREAAALSAREEAWSAYSGVEEAYEALRATEALVASAGESHRLARERYEVGAGTLTDMLDAQASLSQAQARRVSAQASYETARSRYLWASGEILPAQK
jgi:outer membrane protein